MPHLSENNREAIERLERDYRSLPWYARWFFPSAVSGCFTSYYQSGPSNEDAKAFAICMAYLNSIGSIQLWFFSFFDSCFDVFSKTELGRVVGQLHTVGLTGDAAQANFDAVASSQYPWSIADALSTLHTAGLLTGDAAQANFDAVARSQNPWSIAYALRTLHTAGLLSGDAAQANRDAVARSQNPWSIAYALSTLHTAGLLTGDAAQANFDAVASSQNSGAIADALSTLHTAGLLTGDAAQANFDNLIAYSAILTGVAADDYYNPWGTIPDHRLTQPRFNAMIAICQQHRDDVVTGRVHFAAYVTRELLDINRHAAGAAIFNGSQSTHTASVHQSASASASRLMSRYGVQISGEGLERTLEGFSTWLTAQPDSEKVMPAKRCLGRLTAPGYFFTDPASHVSTKQLLALMWIAIHDETHRQGSLDDAKFFLAEGLYEIQREYNLSKTGVDDGCEDLPACAGGTFNKILEKGSCIRQDIVILFINPAGFGLKLPCAVNEEAVAYLRSLPVAKRTSCIEAIKAAGNENTVSPLWEAIQATVETRMFEEFGSLFQNNREAVTFVDAIAAGEYVVLSPNNMKALDQLIPSAAAPTEQAATPAIPRPDGFFTREDASVETTETALVSQKLS